MAMSTTAIVPSKMLRSRVNGRHIFTTSDDNAMMKQIVATHSPDGSEFDVKPLLHVVEDILHRATPTTLLSVADETQETQAQLDLLDEKALHSGFIDMLKHLADPINKISREISWKCSGGSDAHATTVALFNTLSGYSWDAKVVIALAAFAVNYGEFWLVAQLYPTDPLAKSVALLKQLPDILERSDSLKPKFDALTTLIKAVLDVTKCIVELKELPTHYITDDFPAMATAMGLVPTAVYWTIRSIVACASQVMNLVGMGHEYIASTTEAWELSSLAHKVSNIYSHLQNQLDLCHQHIDEKRHIEAYMTLVRLFETPHIDGSKIHRAIIYAKDDQLPLLDGGANPKRRVSIDVLRRKIVLLFISDLDLSHEELDILDQMHTEARQQPTRIESQYEIVWLPVVDRSTPWTEAKQKKFESMQASMKWYSVYHPSLLDPVVIKYIKEVWHFNKKPLLVVLDTTGRVVNTNALHMMWIWGYLGFPFTTTKEEALWKEETWRLELLVDSIEPMIFNWIADGKYICLYGGEDVEWIRRFTTAMNTVAKAAQIQLEMLYLGKSNPKEKVRKNTIIIENEKLSHVLPDQTLIWFFWVRLESMWHSKSQYTKSGENDTIVHEIMSMLTFDGSDQGWAVISRGADMAKAKGDTILKSLTQFEQWRDLVGELGFVGALNENLRTLHTPHHCNRLILPGATGRIPDRVVCAECGRPMEKFIMYRCCTD
ncbi:Protein SIEVE ELEMENT OCCLUSION B like [Actinidia chinensis var. chinensis]|uniref:Protein SIEVE ELEMENT OCCLUSION B like n=1 Tax=Actinidia chinensis var. chinensis TaxID=1590841 RepID=A0A2R6REU9_ACTCC|nr:Protein SIEVE ELEMENT OCCLUSION B like [Actinidia chinensis var. chinensis]